MIPLLPRPNVLARVQELRCPWEPGTLPVSHRPSLPRNPIIGLTLPSNGPDSAPPRCTWIQPDSVAGIALRNTSLINCRGSSEEVGVYRVSLKRRFQALGTAPPEQVIFNP